MTKEQWKGVISEQARRGQSALQFCRERGINDNSFFYWRKKLQEESVQREGFVALESGELVAVELPGGKTVKVRRRDLGALVEAICGR